MREPHSNFDVVIVANGCFPEHFIPLSFIHNANFIVCCDGAANEFIKRIGKPNAIVGDGDSISEENKSLYSDIIYIDGNQETNDLTKAVKYCVQLGKKRMVIVGGTGYREDHTIGNIALLANFMDEVDVKMFTNFGVFTPIRFSTTFHSVKGQQVSIFGVDYQEITTNGLVYPINHQVLKYWWQGTLNEASGSSFHISTNGKAIIYQAYHSDWWL
ncbi:MAG: thiamine diphosphokinase [Chitinophagales bacterium]|nr:thiamine diphosphokinase [Chitinophagales bacterium]MCZ2393882.1 thiamine diphosphokinase [Chitinophagales bacterium]